MSLIQKSRILYDRGEIRRYIKECLQRSQLFSINWRWGTKAWVANRIRDPGSPRRKFWVLWFNCNIIYYLDFQANAISTPPEEYDRKIGTQRNWRGSNTSGGACGLMRWSAQNLTNFWIKLIRLLKQMLCYNELICFTGVARLSSVRVVRCLVKSCNGRNSCFQIYFFKIKS